MRTKEIAQRQLVIGPDEQVPHFITCARPMAVPPELLALPDDARISYEYSIGGQFGRGTKTASRYLDELRETIARQADGYFTLYEAVQVLADSRPGMDPREPVKRFRLAHAKGELRIREGGTRFPKEVNETIIDYRDLLEERELDAWLRESAGYGFPKAAAAPMLAAEPVPAVAAPGTSKRWTPERLEELRAYRVAHGTTKAAEWAGVTAQRVRQLLPGDKPQPKGYSAFNPRPK